MTMEKGKIRRENLNSCRKKLGKKEKFHSKRLSAEISALKKDKVPVKAAFMGEEPLISESMKGLSLYTTENVGERLAEIAPELTNGDFMSLMWQLRYNAVSAEKEEHFTSLIDTIKDVDEERLNLLYNPLCKKYAGDEVYNISDDKTKALFRFITSLNSDATGISEERLSTEYMITAKRSGISVCEVIMGDYRRIFPYTSPTYYIVTQTAAAVGLTALTIVLSNWLAGLSVFTPAMALSKVLIDNGLLKTVRSLPLPSVTREEAQKHRAAAVMSILAADPSDIDEAVEKLNAARLKNNTPNIEYCLLCDLPPADEIEKADDEKIIRRAEELSEKENCPLIIFRRREFSHTQGKYQGKNRKQGAIEELMRYINGENPSFRKVFGDISVLRDIPFMVTLDYDTIPLMDSINSLIGRAVHPINSRYGIFAPRITTSLSSSLKTAFSRITGGSGGCSTACVYDNRASELYFDCFGEGIFTGKGLIRTDRYYRECIGKIPDERVLSHDIIEGAFLETAYCGDTEFNDNTPPTTKGWFGRLHRWYRGDLQNYFFLFDKSLSPMTKFKLSDNIRRVLMDFNAYSALFFSLFSDSPMPVIIVVLSITIPHVLNLIPTAIKGIGFSNRREFYSPVVSLSRNLFTGAMLDLVYLGKKAVLGLDAVIRTVFHIASGKRLLQWTTASAFDKIGAIGYSDMIIPTLFGLFLLCFSVLFGSIPVAIISLFIISCIPVSIWCDRVTPVFIKPIKEEDKKYLTEAARAYWSFFEDYVTKERSFLPPDNVQYSPVYRVAERTSPTNIGMYLLSVISMEIMGIIDGRKMALLIDNTISTVESLEKYKGNLYNWYDTATLEKCSDFVSSVDSGNLLCCLTAVAAKLRESMGNEELLLRIEKLMDKADLSVFYKKERELFSTGIDAVTGKLMPNCYDMLMSEARMLSYYAVSKGIVPKEHWTALSRIMSRKGYYAGPVAWTGTMFEFFMPELLLRSKEGSLCKEAVEYASYCQKRRGKELGFPSGASESGYFGFDKELNYLYKANGVASLALAEGMDEEYVVSPYSSFIALSTDFSYWLKNIRSLDISEFRHEKYGLYEAIDFTESRTGEEIAVVKSHMAHHIGMSIAGIVNTLYDGELQRLFMSDKDMQRGEELLEEKIMTGEIIIDIEKMRDKRAAVSNSEEYREFNVFRPRINIVANHKLALFLSDTGLYRGHLNDGRSTAYFSDDYFRRPEGMFFGIKAEDSEIPFYLTAFDKGVIADRSVVFGENTVEYYTDSLGIASGMKVSLFGENSAEIREIAIENNSGRVRDISFYGYIRPALDRIGNVRSHPMFSELFISEEYDEELSTVFVKRRSRETGEELYMAVGFKDCSGFKRVLSRENALKYNSPLDFKERETDDRVIPAPCVYLNLPIRLEASEKFSSTLFIVYGRTKSEVVGIINDIRDKEEITEAVSPLPKSSLKGIVARKMLPAILYHSVLSEEILTEKTAPDRKALFRFGISGGFPITVMDYDGDELKLNTAIAVNQGLADCGVETDLVIFCNTEEDLSRIESLNPPERKSIFPLIKEKLTDEEIRLIKKSAVYLEGRNTERMPPKKIMDIAPCEQGDFPGEEGFRNNGYVLTEKGYPLCNVLASRSFGTVLSQNSLGFSYAINSRQNKLTPWYNDRLYDNNGEMLLIKGKGRYYDIISGSKVFFAPDKADYYSHVDSLDIETEVRVYKKGMGKRLRVTVTNPTKTEKKCALSYYVEPVMGESRESSLYGSGLTFRSDDRGIYIRNSYNTGFRGEMSVTADRTCYKTTDREGFLSGEVSGEIRAFPLCCGAVTVKLTIPPEKSEMVDFMLCFSRSDSEKMANALKNTETDFYPEKTPVIKSRRDSLDRLYEYWLPWEIVGCRMWARAAFCQNGGAYGYRDQLQDAIAAAYFMPREAKRQILRCCLSQFPEGDVLHWWHTDNAKRTGVRTKCSDDMLWLPYVTAKYCKITGDRDILDIPVRYSLGEALGSSHEKYITVKTSAEKDRVYEHCKKALEKGFDTGKNGLLKFGSGDWNDGYNRVGTEGQGESVWLSMFYVLIVKEFAPLARDYGDIAYAEELEKRGAELSEKIEENAYKDGYYLRGFYDDGEEMGGEDSKYCKLDILPQAFSELAALPDREKRNSALKKAVKEAVDETTGIIRLFTEPFKSDYSEKTGYIAEYPEGIRENGGQYTHGAIWLIQALLRSGDRERAEALTDMINPAQRGKEYKNEPYYMTADIYDNPRCKGRGGWSIYTGSAAWYYMLLRELYGDDEG